MLAPLLVLAELGAQDTLSPPARRVAADVRYLAADAREGRGLGTAGLADAARYVAAAFRAAGLEPTLQEFTVAADAPGAMHANLGGAAARNVIAVLPGASARLRGQVVVVGAHYDHLGRGAGFSMSPDSAGAIHNGADDNASGTAALLEVARRLAGRRPRRTIAFVAFSAEEVGALGSAHYVAHAVPQPADSIYAMLNLDMVGRLRAGRLLALGAETAREFGALLDSLNRAGAHGPRFGDLRASGDGWGPSDHASFYAARRPVLHFFTDLHQDYHRPSDDWEKLDVEGVARIAGFVADLAWALAERPDPLTFVDVPRPAPLTGGQGYGAYLGTIPDMSGSPGGVRITGVRAGSPAERAGLQGGDVLTAIGGKPIANLYDMTAVLRERQPDDTVEIVARRGDRELRVRAVLGRRGS